VLVNFLSNALKFSPTDSDVIISLENVQLQPVHPHSAPGALVKDVVMASHIQGNIQEGEYLDWINSADHDYFYVAYDLVI